MPAAVLEIGTQVQRANGTTGLVAAIEFSYDSQLMYNLTVAAAHTYFVGKGQWLVHNDCGQYDIVRYGTRLTPGSGFQKHHGVLDVWAKENIPGYNSRNAPAIVLTEQQHNLTRAEFNKWRLERTGSITGPIDWANMSPREVQQIADRMFNAANVPSEARSAYYRAFNQYIYGGQTP